MNLLVGRKQTAVITCYLRYVIDPYRVADFERYARRVMPLAEKFGGRHHGYFLPHEGASNVAVALFSFPSLADYEGYRDAIREDEVALAPRRLPRIRAVLSVSSGLSCGPSFSRIRPPNGGE